MGRSHSKATKLPPLENAPLSPREKRDKMKKDVKKKRNLDKQQKKTIGWKNKNKFDEFQIPDSLAFTKRTAKLSDSDYEIEAKRQMQNQLAFDSDIFVLNQMILSVQFFANYERDLSEAVELNRKRENQKTKQLTKHCKTILLPDRLHEAVDRRVKYMEKHGKFKNVLQPIHTQTLYIVHDNIEITNPGDNSVYSILSDAPLYKLQIDDPYEGTRKKKVLQHVGYVKLKSSERITKNDVLSINLSSDSQYVSESLKNEEEDDDDDDENCDAIIPAGFMRNKFRDSMRYARNITSSMGDYTTTGKPLSTTSTNSTSPPSSEYDYTYIRALHTHQPLSMMRQSVLMQNPLSTVMLPDTCISNVSRFMINSRKQEQFYSTGYSTDDESEGKMYDDEQSECYGDNKDQYYYEDKQYLNSKEFLSYFINSFQQTLARDLDISKDTLQNATSMGSAVYCAPWEIIPAISCSWPREANEWVYRDRSPINRESDIEKCQWPTQEMVNKITNFGCHVIPQGYAPKVGTNPQRELEWKIIFPEAERYLESRLTNAQAKIFMITKALIKTFVEPNLERGFNMFTTEHIRAHLFWQCEINHGCWAEDRLGETLIQFLGSLLQAIKIHRLPDYFLPKRNLLENIPEKILVDIHKKIYRIVESPLPFVMITIRNLRYQRDFYPKLKYKRLYSRLIVADPQKILNPKEEINLDALVHAPSDDDEKEAPLGSIAYFDRKERRSRKRRTKCVRFALDENYSTLYVKKREMANYVRRCSMESIDTKVIFLKHMEVLRRKLIYELFIEQFVEMSKVSIKYRALDQTLIYLNQADRICALLVDDQYPDDATKFKEQIEPIRKSLQHQLKNFTQGPALPRRESIADKEKIKIRFRPDQVTSVKTADADSEEEVHSDDDNDEIYNYHQSVSIQKQATSSENLARFNHTDDDECEEMQNSIQKLHVTSQQETSDDDNIERDTKL